MAVDRERLRQKIRDFDLKGALVGELGWDKCDQRPLDIQLDGQEYILNAVADKRGMVVYVCEPGPDGKVPEYKIRKKLDHRVGKIHYEHIIIYVDADQTVQTWQWVRREPGKPAASREHSYYKGGTAENLIQRLERLEFALGEEDLLDIFTVTSRARAAFDLEKVTKKFYDRFKQEHKKFLTFIKGIKDRADQEWYASLMLNRMMFIYFVQKKGFLDNDTDYLRNRLKMMQEEGIKGKYHDFYRLFLLRLFHEGLGLPEAERKPELAKLLGKVPYLNGGLFDVHELEIENPKIKIPDEAFEEIFNFFDEYNWHLDERPLRADNEINPDVLGYIFEKYINQKQMGAYYTKEDITGYISRNTVIPFLFDQAKKECNIAFDEKGAVWSLLKNDPDRYIYKAVRHGVTWDYRNDCPLDEEVPYPPEIEDGLDTTKPNLIERRKVWNAQAPEEAALPTEIWREVVARRQRYQEVKAKMEAGEISSINDLITYNLDIQQFAQDVIENCEGPELLRAFWVTIHGQLSETGTNKKFRQGITVLDPACGSGAFLFAALNILEPLYVACLERMRRFIEEKPKNSKKFEDFEKILAEVDGHPNEHYFVFKSIVVNNLYGVDIMAEAVEICKLRLFLKLVSQLESADQIEPLPDIDFNIRAGNSLVGFATVEDVEKAVKGSGSFDFDDSWDRIKEKAEMSSLAFRRFREMQTKQGMKAKDFRNAKEDLRKRLDELRDELDRYLAIDYGEDPGKPRKYKQWHESHQPFHWLVEFYGIMSGGGFDVVIGNPPWKKYSSVRKMYSVCGYSTESCGNLHGIFTERSLELSSDFGRMSYIVQLPMASSSRMTAVRKVILENSSVLHLIPFDDRPGKLFNGLQHCRSVIFLLKKQQANKPKVYNSKYQRWNSSNRGLLFDLIHYSNVVNEQIISEVFPKIATVTHDETLSLCKMSSNTPIKFYIDKYETEHLLFYQEATQYWVKATYGLPYYAKNEEVGAPAHGRYVFFSDDQIAYAVCSLLNSTLFYLYFITYGDCFHLSDTLVSSFPITEAIANDKNLSNLGKKLMDDLESKSERQSINLQSGDVITYAEYFGSKSKDIIDDIDRLLAEHYGFNEQQLDFIINYDIKFRMGQDLTEDESTD